MPGMQQYQNVIQMPQYVQGYQQMPLNLT